MDKLIAALLKQALIHLTTWLKPQLIKISYERQVQGLKVGVEKLKKVRDDVQYNAYVEEKNLNGREIPVEVKEWIEEVQNIICDYEAFDGDNENHEVAVFTSGFLPKPGIRCRRSIKACDITRRVNEFLRRAEADVFSYWINPPFLPPFLSNISFHRFPSRDETVKKIKVALEDSNVRIVGLHGFSGVGKTTLVKQVAKEALQAKLFDVVIMADVTKNPDVRKIQGQIAEMLGMTLNKESDIARATQIGEKLKKEKSMLIILDDLWAKIDFNMLGIPSNKDNILESVEEGKSLDAEPETHLSMMRPKKHPVASNKMTNSRYKGCKVLLISETKQVLLSQMEGKGNSISYVNVLDEKDAKWLFEHTAGISDGNFEFGKLAAQIASKCKGLPMLIITTAKALEHQSRSIWEDALQKLESQKLIGVSEFSTKLSYDLLENEELKYTFLLCARMDNDALIMDLVKYCIGFGFLQEVCTVKEVRDRVYSLVGKLKEFGLLSDSYSSDHFTMQDIVRSAAFSIASQEGKHLLTMTKGKVDEWPDEDLLERYFAISLQYCDLIEGFPISINCPKLRVFQVNNNDPRLDIPEKFFEGMKELRVLILTGISLSPSDSSISCLQKLRMLCLEHCMLDEDLSIIGELKKLRILSLSGSDVKKLPAELKKLTKLQILDISNCSKLLKIPSGVISSLINLEELYMRNTLIQWKVEERTNQSENASLSELRHLNHLKALDIQFPKVDHLPKDLFFDMLHSYKIVIGDLNTYLETDFKMPEKYETSRFLGIHLKDGFDIHSQINIKMLFDGVENLLLGDLNGVQDIFYGLNLKGFPYLKHLSIRSNSNIKSLVNPKHKQHAEKVFPELESLYLYNLNNMINICSSKLSETSFGKLKVIKINLCGKLKNIFLFSVVKLLIILETIEVSECDSLKEIVFVESDNENETLTFRELRTLTLQSLSAFIAFYPISSTKRELFHKQVRVSKLERMELSSIPIDKIWSDQPSLSTHFGNLIHLEVNGCRNLESLLSFSMAESLVNLQRLSISDSEKMEHIFSQEQGSNVKIEASIFPNLKNIKLSNMKSLHEIWNTEFPLDSFGKLDTLTIEECDKFVSVFPCFMKGALQSLYYLSITNCRSMNVIFDLDGGKQDTGVALNLQDVHLEALPKLKHVWKWNKDQVLNFEKLQKICVRYCHSLMNIFPNSVTKFQSLKHLVLQDCFELREIVAREEATGTKTPGPLFEFPELTTIKLYRLPKLKSFYPGAYDFSCPALIDLSIELCMKLEPFIKEIADVQRASILFPEEVLNKLKYMQIESEHVKSSHSYMGEGNYRRHNLEELHLSGLKDTEVLYAFLHSYH